MGGIQDARAGRIKLCVNTNTGRHVCVRASQSCRAQNCWYTARMWWSSSAVNSRFSSVPMYCWMVTWCCGTKGNVEGTSKTSSGSAWGELCLWKSSQRQQCEDVCVCVSRYHEEDLLEPLDAVFVPGRADVHAARLAANQMFRQQHDEALP